MSDTAEDDAPADGETRQPLRRMTPDELAMIIDLSQRGWGVCRIARKLGRAHSSIHTVLVRRGLSTTAIVDTGPTLPTRRCMRCGKAITSRWPGLCRSCREYAARVSPMAP